MAWLLQKDPSRGLFLFISFGKAVKQMRRDPFSQYHPAVNFLFFVAVIGFGVVVQHPAYAAAGCVCSMSYFLILKGSAGFRFLVSMVPVFLLITVLNPLINTSGELVLFSLFGRPYTLEALCYGLIIAAVFLITMLWFGCYSEVLTSDKFTSLFGNWIPALSLLLVMVLRLIPEFMRKTKQIAAARSAIGKGGGDRLSQKLRNGGNILSSLTDWALEGSIVTSDSMRARGYGFTRRTCFRMYRMTRRDVLMLVLMAILSACVLLAGGMDAGYTPALYCDYVTWGFGAYCVLLVIPTLMHIGERVLWNRYKFGT